MIRFFAFHPTAANLMMMTFILFGLVSLPQIKRETFPEFSPPFLLASMVYPGASPEQVEQAICLPMEEAVDGLSGIDETRCEALENVGSMVIKLLPTADTSRLLVDVQTQINAIQGLPNDVETPVVREFDWKEPVIDVAISGNADLMSLKAYAEQLKQRLKQGYGVSLVSVQGFSDRQLRIEVNEKAMRELGLTLTEIAQQIQRQNINFPSGNLSIDNKDLLLRFDQQVFSPDKLAKLVIATTPEGGLVRLEDIAAIAELFSSEEQTMWFDGEPAVMLKISKNKADDSLKIKERVTQFVEDEKSRVPDGIKLTLTNDFSSLLWDRLTMMAKNGGQGVILVFAVMWLFFSLRYSFWVAAGLPVAFMGSFFLMAQLGLSINIMSLVALLMAIGIMMDDAIVISESIAAHIDKGIELKNAVIQGVNKVLPGVISSYLTTVCIFGSLIFLQGEMGAVLRVVPMVLILVLTISLVEAFLILPHHLLHSLDKEKKSRQPLGVKRQFLAWFERIQQETLPQMVQWVVRWRYGFVGGVLAMLLISISLLTSGMLKFVGFPELDGDIAEARLILAPGASLDETEKAVKEIIRAGLTVSKQLSDTNDEPSSLVVNVSEFFNYNPDADEKGAHLATVRMDLLGAETRNTLIDDFLLAWQAETATLPSAVSVLFKQPQMGPGGRAFDIRLQHESLSVLKTASLEIQAFIRQFQGVSGVLDDMRPGKEEIKISLKAGAELYGVTGQTIASQLQAAYFGVTADDFQQGSDNIDIQVQLAENDLGSTQGLANFPIMLPDGRQLPLSTLANLDYQRSFVRIQRIDGARTISVYGDVIQSQVAIDDVLIQLKQEVIPQLMQQYPDLLVQFEGKAKDSAKTGQSMGTGFLLGLFGIFVILSFQFRSYLEPFVVILAIPLALIGVLWGHLLLGHPLSMPSLMGFVSLAGVVVNDSILLVQYIRHHINDGQAVLQAVVSASQARFRAVFLTSLTTAVGLLPLLLETSLQAQVVKPLVISIVFGIFTSTLLVLFMIPAAYAILGDFGKVKVHQNINSA